MFLTFEEEVCTLRSAKYNFYSTYSSDYISGSTNNWLSRPYSVSNVTSLSVTLGRQLNTCFWLFVTYQLLTICERCLIESPRSRIHVLYSRSITGIFLFANVSRSDRACSVFKWLDGGGYLVLLATTDVLLIWRGRGYIFYSFALFIVNNPLVFAFCGRNRHFLYFLIIFYISVYTAVLVFVFTSLPTYQEIANPYPQLRFPFGKLPCNCIPTQPSFRLVCVPSVLCLGSHPLITSLIGHYYSFSKAPFFCVWSSELSALDMRLGGWGYLYRPF